MKYILIAVALVFPTGLLLAQNASHGPSAPVPLQISLEQAVNFATNSGDQFSIIKANLAGAQAANDATQAKNGFTVSSAVSYGLSESFNNAGVNNASNNPYAAGVNSSPVVPTASVGGLTLNGSLIQNPSASVTAGWPMTNLSVGLGTGIQGYQDGSLRNVANLSAKLSQTIWNGYAGGPTKAAADKANIALQISQLSSENSRKSTIVTLKQAFYAMLSAQQNLTLLQATLESRQATVSFVQAKLTARVVSEVDLMQAGVNQQSAELDLSDGQNKLKTARQRLANLMGIDPDTQFSVIAEADPTIPVQSLAGAIALGLSNRSELKIANLNAQSSLVDKNLASGAGTPSFVVSGGVNYLLDTVVNKNSLVGQVSLNLGAPLWDAGASSSQTLQAQKAIDAYTIQMHQLNQSIPVDIEEAWKAWQQAQKRYDLSLRNRDTLERQLAITQAQFDAHVKMMTDVFTAQINASAAEFAVLTAKINAQLAALQVLNLLGL